MNADKAKELLLKGLKLRQYGWEWKYIHCMWDAEGKLFDYCGDTRIRMIGEPILFRDNGFIFMGEVEGEGWSVYFDDDERVEIERKVKLYRQELLYLL